jgi:type I restriction enzyme, R subunit
VDLAGLMLTHYRLRKDGVLVGVTGEPAAPRYLDPITENGLRDPQDAHKAYLAELVEKLNNAFGADISETDKVALAVHVSEKLRGDQVVMAQVEHNTKEQAMKANLPQAAVQIIVGAMQSHQTMATKLLSDESTRGLFLDVVYDLLKRDSGSDLMRHART